MNVLIVFWLFFVVLAKYNTMIKSRSMYKEKKYFHECLIRDLTVNFNLSFKRTQNKFQISKVVRLSLLATHFPVFVPP